MSLIRRISASLTSSVDRAVSRVENHDAVINAALRDTQQAAARSRVRLERVRKDGHNLRTRKGNLETAVTRWTERAKAVGTEDEAKALECLRRKKECEAQLCNLEVSIEKHDELEARIGELIPAKDKSIVVHCHHGGRSEKAVRLLLQRGFAGAENLDGGIEAWSLTVDPSVPRYS